MTKSGSRRAYPFSGTWEYQDEIALGGRLIMDFRGIKNGGVPYYSMDGIKYSNVSSIPGWNFTRASGGYAPKADGTLQWFNSGVPRINDMGYTAEPAATNLLIRSQEFDHATWSKIAGSVTANATTAPDNTLTADLFTENTASSYHGLAYEGAYTFGTGTYTSSVYLKASGNNFAYIWLDTASGDGYTVEINLITGALRTTRPTSPFWTLISTSVISAANGWWRFSITASTTQTIVQTRIYTSPTAWVSGNYGTPTYTGGGVNGLFIWGAQIETGLQHTSYIPTTTVSATRAADQAYISEVGGKYRTNMILRSNQFDKTSWLKTSADVTADAIAGPDGLVNVDKITEQAAASVHNVQQSITVVNGSTYTMSVVLKAAERNWVALYEGVGGKGKWFNLSSGTIGGNLIAAPSNATITSLGNGFYRCSITTTISGAVSASPGLWLGTDGTAFSYTGVSGNGVYATQMQYEIGSLVTEYIPTTTIPVTVREPFSTVAKILGDFRRNWLLYSNDFTNAIWQKTNITTTPGVQDPFGGNTATRITATASTAGLFQSVLSMSGVSSIWIRRVSGTGEIRLRSLNAGVITVVEPDSTWQRFVNTVNTGTSASIIDIMTSGDVIDIYGAQTETGICPTDYIPTVASAVTVGNTYSVNTEAHIRAGTDGIDKWAWSSFTEQNDYEYYVAHRRASNNVCVTRVVNTSPLSSSVSASAAATGPRSLKWSSRFRTDSTTSSENGGALTTFPYPGPDKMQNVWIGRWAGGGHFGGQIRKLVIYGNLTDAQLQSLSTN